MSHSPPGLGSDQLSHFQPQPGKLEWHSSICWIDTKYSKMPALLPPQALEDDLQVPPDNTFQKITLKRGQWGASNVVSFTWTALSPNPTRRDPKRPPNEDPVSQVLFILCLLFNFWKRNVPVSWGNGEALVAGMLTVTMAREKAEISIFILKHFWLRPKTIRISWAERLAVLVHLSF